MKIILYCTIALLAKMQATALLIPKGRSTTTRFSDRTRGVTTTSISSFKNKDEAAPEPEFINGNNAMVPLEIGEEAQPPKSISKDTKIAIVGGGIGGMVFALSLVDAGFHNIDIYESTSLGELGVGINIQPHGVRELIELGLGDELARTGIPTKEIRYFHKNGQFIYGEARGLGAGYNWPQYSIHRGKLLGLLHRSVQLRLGDDRIHTGNKVINCGSSDEDDGAWAELLVRNDTSHSEKSITIKADLIVGCDGVHSKVRKSLTNEGSPAWMGITMLRGVTRMKPFLSGRTMTIIGPIDNEMV